MLNSSTSLSHPLSSAIITPTTSTTSLDEDAWLDDILVVAIWSIILIYAFITNTLTLVGICRSPKMRRATSYWIVSSLAVCDWFMIIISLIHIIPSTYLHQNYVEILSTQTIVSMFLYNVFWYSGVIQLAAMAVNRFVSIVFPLHYKRIFSPKNTIVVLGLLYLAGLLASVPALHQCCYIVYDHHIYVTYYSPEDSGYMWVDIALNTLSLITMIVCYACILIKVRRSTLRRRRYQLAAKAGQASGAVLLIAAAAAAASSGPSSSAKNGGGLGAETNGTDQRRVSRLDWTVWRSKVVNSPMFPRRKPSSMTQIVDGRDYGSQVSVAVMERSISRRVLHQSSMEEQQSSRSADHRSSDLDRSAIDPDRSTDDPNEPGQMQPSNSLAERRRSITSPNLRLLAVCDTLVINNILGQSATSTIVAPPLSAPPTSAPPPASSASLMHRPSAALAALQRQPDQAQQATRREIRLFVQFFVVSLVFLSTWATWQWLPRIPGASKWIYFSTTTFFFINNAVNPTVYLIFNTGLRNEIKGILLCQWTDRFKRGAHDTHGGAKFKFENASMISNQRTIGASLAGSHAITTHNSSSSE